MIYTFSSYPVKVEDQHVGHSQYSFLVFSVPIYACRDVHTVIQRTLFSFPYVSYQQRHTGRTSRAATSAKSN
jgi:hypothetical protein